MNILLIGSGGREHALATAYAKSKRVNRVFVAPGNDFMSFQNQNIKTLSAIGVLDFPVIADAVITKKIDLVDVAQDDPLAKGLVDYLQKQKIPVFGPTQNASEIEWNKQWARQFMGKYKLPIPKYKSFSDGKSAAAYVEKLPEQTLFIKASGLALGKGVIKATTRKEGLAAISKMKMFGKAGETFLIEEALVGEEFSLFALCNGKDYTILATAQDHKTVFEKDQGPNTGGMGCVSPTTLLTAKERHTIEKTILKPFINGMEKEGRPYTGILYLGGMKTKTGPKIIEFNARWGDPEAEVIIPGIQTDYLRVVEQTLAGKKAAMKMDKKIRISIAGCARGYPNDYKGVLGKPIFELEEAMKLPGITIFGAGLKKKGKQFVINGGRIFHLVAEGKTITQARTCAYAAMSRVTIPGDDLHYRNDIGWREIERNC